MIVEARSGNALVMEAAKGGVDSGVCDAGFLPERDLAPPVVVVADARRHPDFQSDRSRIAAFSFDQGAQLFECLQRLVTGRIGERHEAVAVLGSPPERR